MKKALLFITLISFSNFLFAQSEKYTAAMQKNIALLDSALKNGTLTELANGFTRIADAEKTQWLPYYYAAYCTVMSAFVEKENSKKDAIADNAETLIIKAETLAGKPNSETHVIRSMIASAHMMVDPQSRWQQYGQASSDNIASSKELDPTNPRPVYLEGQAKFYTPEAFGGGKTPAKELFEKALGMFDSFNPKTELDPNWGKAATLYFLEQCK
ncbi:MAG: hypothetical protein ABIN36_14530 [Ferruginibacter sp.]